jgi:hypothetical protein
LRPTLLLFAFVFVFVFVFVFGRFACFPLSFRSFPISLTRLGELSSELIRLLAHLKQL